MKLSDLCILMKIFLFVGFVSKLSSFETIDILQRKDYEYKEIYFSLVSKNVTCPLESEYILENDAPKCRICEHGKSRTINDDESCNECLPNFEKIYQNDGSFHCMQCDENSLILSHNKGVNTPKCTTTDCSLLQYYDDSDNKCVSCSVTVQDSIGRPMGSSPLLSNCQCPEDYFKINIENRSTICLKNTDFKIRYPLIFAKLKEIDNKTDIYTYKVTDQFQLKFILCKPYSRFYSQEKYCICPEGYIFLNDSCKSCSYLKSSNGFDTSDCYCKRGFEPLGNKCVECPNGYFKVSSSNESCMKCPFFYTTQNTGSSKPQNCSKLKLSCLIYLILLFSLILAIISIFVYILIRKNKKNTSAQHSTKPNYYRFQSNNAYN